MPSSTAPEAPPAGLRFDAVTLDHARPGEAPFRALDAVSFTLPPRARIGIAGPSGAGKSTLLHLAAALRRPTLGRILWGETDLGRLPDQARTRLRREAIGFVFQDFHLVDELSALDNVVLPARFAAWRIAAETTARARDLLARCGLVDPARPAALDRKSTRLNSSHTDISRMPSSA